MSEQFVQVHAQETADDSTLDASDNDQSRVRVASASSIEEARKYRKRAQAAEKAVEQLHAQIVERDQTIAQQKESISALERRQAIDAQLRLANAIDLETARALIEATVSAAGGMAEADVSAAVEELKRSKPHLFRTVQKRASIAAPKSGHDDSARAGAIEQAAVDASTSGKRGDLLRYLRLRRR